MKCRFNSTAAVTNTGAGVPRRPRRRHGPGCIHEADILLSGPLLEALVISKRKFFKLSTAEVAKLVKAAGPQVCVFPINGTRRWFMLQHAHDAGEDPAQAYLSAFEKRSIEIAKLLFQHGLDTLLTPVFGEELLHRGDQYNQMAAAGMAHMANHPDFLSFYREYGVRVHFYGDYRKHLDGTEFSYLIDLFDRTTRDTAGNDSYRLFYGVFADDATEAVAELTIRHFQENGDVPLRRELVAAYYGEYIEPATLVIGFDKFSVFDYPLLGVGRENLYFTLAPSPYLTERQLRDILYDHVFLRAVEDPDYSRLPEHEMLFMQDFYLANREATLGVGGLHGGIWYPETRIKVPADGSNPVKIKENTAIARMSGRR